MKYLFVFVLTIILIISIYYFYKKNIKNKSIKTKNKYKFNLANQNNDSNNKIEIKIEQLPVEKVENYKLMSEITDNKILARINNLVPQLAQVGTTANNAIKANSNVLYQAIIPAGATLTPSKSMKNAVRGFYRGDKNIEGHANFLKVNQSRDVVANTISTGIGITSMIVGQYYMTQINAELIKINDELSKIGSFQDNEYESRVMALLIQIKRISSFQSEIIENQELRNSDINKLILLEQSCIELLGQANLTITKYTKEYNLDYKEYDEKLTEIHKWHIYQKALLEMLYKITELKNILYLGKISKEQLNIILQTYTKQVMDVHQLLVQWHKKITNKLKIDTETSRRKRNGLDGIVHWIPGLFKDDFNFCNISEKTKNMIEEQSSNYNLIPKFKDEELFNKDVKVISKDGKLYYLP